MPSPILDPRLFDLHPDHLWVMHCSEGPVPLACAEAIRAFAAKELRPWLLNWKEDFLGLPEQARERAAQVIGAKPRDISLLANTSAGLEAVTSGFPWKAGDEVLAPLGEFPSNAWPWKALEARGVSFREVPLWEGHRSGAQAWEGTPPGPGVEPERCLLEALTPATRMVALSWIRFQDGLKLDLRSLGEALRRRGICLVVDGIQGAGTAMPDLTHVDAFASGGHKGLLAPQGIGFLWTDARFRSLLAPQGTWLSVVDGTNFTRPSTDFDRRWLGDGRALEPGGPASLMCAGFVESLKVLGQAGVGNIEAHLRELQARFLKGLEAITPWRREACRLQELLEQDRLGSILAIHHEGRGSQAMLDLLESGTRLGIYASVREGYLRIAFHGYHGDADADRVLAWLGRAVF